MAGMNELQDTINILDILYGYEKAVISGEIEAESNINTQELEALGVAISTLTKQLNNEWIPASERLPEIRQDVLVTYRNGNIAVDFIHEDGQWFWEDGEEGIVVAAWKPLPEPYKEEAYAE